VLEMGPKERCFTKGKGGEKKRPRGKEASREELHQYKKARIFREERGEKNPKKRGRATIERRKEETSRPVSVITAFREERAITWIMARDGKLGGEKTGSVKKGVEDIKIPIRYKSAKGGRSI